MSEEQKIAWTEQKKILNARPTFGTFSGALPETLVCGNYYSNNTLDSIVCRLLKKYFMDVQHQMEKCFKRYENGKQYTRRKNMFSWRFP